MNKKFEFGYINVEITSILSDGMIKALDAYYDTLMESVRCGFSTTDSQFLKFVKFLVTQLHYSIEVTFIKGDRLVYGPEDFIF